MIFGSNQVVCMVFEEEFFALSPINFFQISADCHYLPPSKTGEFPSMSTRQANKYKLPDTSALCHQDNFAEVSLGWNELGIEALMISSEPFHRVTYPDVTRGDSLEIFIDTRDVKTSGFNTRFCHHFFFLPEAMEGHQAEEITRFRTEDVHELCNPNDLKVKFTKKNNQYTLQIFIPNQCLYGYDPEQFDRMGFTYRINRVNGSPQHFSVVSEDYQLEQQPSLWSSLKLVK